MGVCGGEGIVVGYLAAYDYFRQLISQQNSLFILHVGILCFIVSRAFQ